MKLSIMFLPAIALAMALAPFAAQAQAQAQAQAAVQTANGGCQTVVQSGPVNQMYPDSVGG
jgi:hypothetical protein